MYLLNVKHLDVRIDFVMIVLGGGFLWLSSRLFPWPVLQKYFPVLNTDLQFPKRFLSVALSALGLMLGILLTWLQHRMNNRVLVACILTFILGMFVIHAWQNTQSQARYLYHQQATRSYYGEAFHKATGDIWLNHHRRPVQLKRSLESDKPGRYFGFVTKTTPDYLPTTQKIKSDAQYHHLNAYNRYYQQVVQNRVPSRIRLQRHTAAISFRRRSNRTVTLPFVKYAHTRVRLNGKTLGGHPSLTSIGALKIRPKAGVNRLTVKYVPSSLYKGMTGLSVIIWAWFILNIFYEIRLTIYLKLF